MTAPVTGIMDDDDLENAVIRIVADILGRPEEEFGLETELDELADPSDLVDIAIAVYEELDVDDMPDETDMPTIGRLVEWVRASRAPGGHA